MVFNCRYVTIWVVARRDVPSIFQRGFSLYSRLRMHASGQPTEAEKRSDFADSQMP